MTTTVNQLNIAKTASSAVTQKMLQVLITDDNGAHNLTLRVDSTTTLTKAKVLRLAEARNGASFVNPYNVLFTQEEEFNA